MKKYLLFIGAITALIFINTTPTAASDFNAGRIMDDSVFTNKSTMSVNDIQAFLNSKVPACDTNGQQTSEFGGPDLNGDGRVQRWEWGKARYNQTTFPCLKEYKQDGVSAAQLIYNAAQNYSINPQVLIVLLQKEQGLVTDTWPLNVQYRSATGYGCPDTAACDAQYYGLKNQLNWAATMFRSILNNSSTWYTPYVLGNNYIQYNPNSSCGGSNVYIQNRTTQALYNYTPYQPSQAAIDAGWGQVHCGAYGNRNFHLYFTSWFGNTRAITYVKLDNPRWMKIRTDTYKTNTLTNENVDGLLPKDTHLKFTTKTMINGQWYLRTEYDSAVQAEKGILIDNLQDITYTALQTPRYMQLATDLQKKNPFNDHVADNGTLPKDLAVKFTSKITVNGSEYFRSAYDESIGSNYAVLASNVKEMTYLPFEQQRFMQIRQDTHKINPATGSIDNTPIPQGTQYKFASKIIIDDKWYYRTDADTTANIPLAIPITDIEAIPYENYNESSYWFQLKSEANKVIPSYNGKLNEPALTSGTKLKIVKKISVNGILYYQTQYDTTLGLDKAIIADAFEEIPYTPLETPRIMKLNTNTTKVNPASGLSIDGEIAKGSELKVTTKILIDGVWYLRTEHDTTNNLSKAIPIRYFSEVN